MVFACNLVLYKIKLHEQEQLQPILTKPTILQHLQFNLFRFKNSFSLLSVNKTVTWIRNSSPDIFIWQNWHSSCWINRFCWLQMMYLLRELYWGLQLLFLLSWRYSIKTWIFNLFFNKIKKSNIPTFFSFINN